MKTTDLWDQYKHYTKEVTEYGRRLAFAGAGVCWLLKTADFRFPHAIYWALLFLVIHFLLDMVQHLAGAVRTKNFIEGEEARLWQEGGTIEGEVQKPKDLDFPVYCLFLAKTVALFAAFICIGIELVWRIR